MTLERIADSDAPDRSFPSIRQPGALNYRNLFMVFWGLIAAKCLTLEWAIQHYAMPINGWLFIWTPSFIFGILCVAVYLSAHPEVLRQASAHTRFLRKLWAAILASFVALAALGLNETGLRPIMLPGLAALLAALGYFIEGIYLSHHRALIMGALWLSGSVFLFFWSGPSALGFLAAVIVILVVVPAAFSLWKNRDKVAAAGL